MTRQALKDAVAARVDMLVPTGDNVGGSTFAEASIETIDRELDLAASYIVKIAPREIVMPTAKYDLKHFHGDSVEDVETRLIVRENDMSGLVVCPQDFLRLLSLKLDSWNRELVVLMSQSDPLYRNQRNNQITGGSVYKPTGALSVFGSYTSGERKKWIVDKRFNTNQTLTGLYDGETVDGYAISTDDILVLANQSIYSQNGTYKANATGSPTKLSDEVPDSSGNYPMPNKAIEVFRAGSTADVVESFIYVPRLLAEEVPEDLVNSLIWQTAGNVLESNGESNLAKTAWEQALLIINNHKEGLMGE